MAKTKNKFEGSLYTCPFCKTRKRNEEMFCFGCNLNFSEVENYKVKDTIKYKKQGKPFQSYEGEIVGCPLLPNDVSFLTMKMLVVFFGFFGLHNFYAGRILRGFITLVFSFLLIGSALFVAMLAQKDIDATILFIYFGIINVPLWIVDCFCVFKRRFKYPCVLKTPIDIERIYAAGTKQWK